MRKLLIILCFLLTSSAMKAQDFGLSFLRSDGDDDRFRDDDFLVRADRVVRLDLVLCSDFALSPSLMNSRLELLEIPGFFRPPGLMRNFLKIKCKLKDLRSYMAWTLLLMSLHAQTYIIRIFARTG